MGLEIVRPVHIILKAHHQIRIKWSGEFDQAAFVSTFVLHPDSAMHLLSILICMTCCDIFCATEQSLMLRFYYHAQIVSLGSSRNNNFPGTSGLALAILVLRYVLLQSFRANVLTMFIVIIVGHVLPGLTAHFFFGSSFKGRVLLKMSCGMEHDQCMN